MAEGQAFLSKDPAVRKVSEKLGTWLWEGPVGEAEGSSAQADQSEVPGEQANLVCYGVELGQQGAGGLCLSAPNLKWRIASLCQERHKWITAAGERSTADSTMGFSSHQLQITNCVDFVISISTTDVSEIKPSIHYH